VSHAEDHLRYFTVFLVTLLDDFARYLHHSDRDLLADGWAIARSRSSPAPRSSPSSRDA
jgi:hypothetical protein